MNNSIENIWKDGFLKNDALKAPKINDLYNQKSIHIIDKFKRMFKINLIVISIFSVLFLIVTYLLGVPLMGIIFSSVILIIAIINKLLLNDLEKIDSSLNSYQYLKDFNHWIQKQITLNRNISTFLYPVMFMSIVIGLWYKDVNGIILGEKLIQKFLISFPESYLIQGIPIIGIIIILFIIGLSAFFGGKIYLWDMNLIYGGIFKKLEKLITEIDELNS